MQVHLRYMNKHPSIITEIVQDRKEIKTSDRK